MKRVAASCCSHWDKPGGKRCAVLRIPALPNTLKLKPYGSSGPPPALCRWSHDWQLPIAPRPYSSLGASPQAKGSMEISEACSCQLLLPPG